MTTMGFPRRHVPEYAAPKTDTFTERHPGLVGVLTLLVLVAIGTALGSGLGAALVNVWQDSGLGELLSGTG